MKSRAGNESVASVTCVARKVTALVAVALGTTSIALATPQSLDYRGTPLLVGGVSEEEREAMRPEAATYNVWLVFVERDTGNYLAGVKVRVVDGNDNAVVDTVADGPWLLAKLPPGRYRVLVPGAEEQPIAVSTAGQVKTVLRLAHQP